MSCNVSDQNLKVRPFLKSENFKFSEYLKIWSENNMELSRVLLDWPKLIWPNATFGRKPQLADATIGRMEQLAEKIFSHPKQNSNNF
jgi:hypothetical protein